MIVISYTIRLSQIINALSYIKHILSFIKVAVVDG